MDTARRPAAPREARARTALEALLGLAAIASFAIGAAERSAAPDLGAVPPLVPLPVDLARDPPGRLRLLPGLGRARVEALLRDRECNGPPRRLPDLARVRGLGPKTLAALAASGAVVEGGAGHPPGTGPPGRARDPPPGPCR